MAEAGHHVRIHAKDELDELHSLLQDRFGPSITPNFTMDYAIRFALAYERQPQKMINYLQAQQDLTVT